MTEEKQIELNPCPFCGGEATLYSMKRDKRKVLGVYHMIAEIRCTGVLGCTARVSQAGFDEKRAFENAALIWNRRADNDRKEADG